MAKLSIAKLNLLHQMDSCLSDASLEAARSEGTIKPAEAEEIDTLLHEAAHFCAAVVVQAFIDTVRVSRRTRTSPTIGLVGSSEPLGDVRCQIFVSLVGYEWELMRTGDGGYGACDLERAKAEAQDAARWTDQSANQIFDEVQRAARLFVHCCAREIRKVAAGISLLRDKRGYLPYARIWALVDWVRPQLPRSLDTLTSPF